MKAAFIAIIVTTLGSALGAAPAWADSVIKVAPGEDDQDTIQTALIEVEEGGTVELAPGTYTLVDGLSLDIDGVTVRGAGKHRTILSFKGQETGGEALLVTSNNVTLRGFAIEDSKGDAFKAKDVKNIAMLDLRAEWTNGPDAKNGAYGLYPVGSDGVLIDGCLAVGASDAGIYVGQSRNIIVRNSVARDNVAGFEIENSYNADMYDNTAVNNTGGFLVFDLPNLPQQGGHNVRVFNNIAVNNNTPNFAPEGNIVATVPQGLGIMVMANRDVDVFNNTIEGNQSVAILISTYPNEFKDKKYQPHPKAIHVHGNRYSNNGYAPMGVAAERVAPISGTPVPDVVWDGLSPLDYKNLKMPIEDWIFVNEPDDVSFVNLNLAESMVSAAETPAPNPKTDLAPHRVEKAPLPAVDLDFGE